MGKGKYANIMSCLGEPLPEVDDRGDNPVCGWSKSVRCKQNSHERPPPISVSWYAAVSITHIPCIYHAKFASSAFPALDMYLFMRNPID